MLALSYVAALFAAACLGVRIGRRSFVMPATGHLVAFCLVVSGMLALVPVIFFEITWFTALLSILGAGGWSAMFVMLRQVTARKRLWDEALAHTLSTRRS